VGQGTRLLLHICCAPCSTYCIQRLRGLGFDLTGFWYNPNIHLAEEHERRRASLERYAAQVEQPVLWEAGYEPGRFFDALAGHEAKGERCARCYWLRLNATARRAAQGGFDAFTTTLLISPYQDQQALRDAGEAAARDAGIAFHFEDMRRGWSERGRLANLYGLYKQRYCGCAHSEREASEARAARAAREAAR
jgi:hypothetical protein